MNLIIASQAISTHNGLFSLNDLHKVSGGADKHRPSFFLRNAETKELIAEIENSNCANLHSLKNKQIAVITIEGKKGGTFVCRELVYRYAMWISAKFSLMVIRAFDALNTGAIPALKNPTLSENQAYRLKRAVELKCKDNRLHYQTIWTAPKNHFGKTSYKDILAADFDEAMTFIANFGFGSFLANVDMVELHDALADCAVLLREYNCMMQMLINFGYAGTNLYGTKNPMYQPSNCLHRLMRLVNALNLKTCDGVPMFTHDSINFYHGKSHHIVA